MKTCCRCKKSKDSTEFHKTAHRKDGLSDLCKPCNQVKGKLYRQLNKESIRIKAIEYRTNNAEKLKKKRKERYIQNSDILKNKSKKYRENNKEKIKESKYNYQKRNRGKINLKVREKRKIDPMFRLNDSISKQIGKIKNGISWSKILDYSFEELALHLESKFTKGMTWENYGKDGWHIDHIIPKSYFKFDSKDHPAFKACWALSNLQPLWATREIAVSHGEDLNYIGNFDKGNRIKITRSIQKLLDSVNISHSSGIIN